VSGTLAAVGFIVTLILVILIHEAGHFFMAKRFDIKVEEYFVGFGPRLWSTRRGETEYGVKAILLGGYVKIAGMNPFAEPAEEDLPRTFGAKPVRQRAAVIAAGPISHFIMAFIAIFIWMMFVGRPGPQAEITLVEPRLEGVVSPAAAAGFQPGDVVVSVDGRDVDIEGFIDATRANVDEQVTVVVMRDGEETTLTATPVLSDVGGEEVGRLGVSLDNAREHPGVFGAIAGSGQAMWDTTGQVVTSVGRVFGPEGIGRLFSLVFGDAQRSVDDPFSIVGGARLASQVAQAGQFEAFVGLFVSFNIFVGILNLLPLLPFDGGHLAVLAIEKVRGRPVDMRKLVPVSAVVAALLLTFMAATVYLDIFKPIPNPLGP
jgi:membrane-associated protease RseP (regulator of RpoE activity)